MQCAFVFTIKWELRKLSTQRMLLLVSGFGLCGCWSQWRPPRPLFSLGPRCQLSPRATLQHPVHQPIQRQRSIPADSMAVIAKLSCAGICIVIVCTALRFYDINAFIAANGETPFTRVPSFDHWRILVFRCDMFVTVAKSYQICCTSVILQSILICSLAASWFGLIEWLGAHEKNFAHVSLDVGFLFDTAFKYLSIYLSI